MLPFDCGLSASRNWICDHTAGNVLMLDDDFEFTQDTKVELLQDVLDAEPNLAVKQIVPPRFVEPPTEATDGSGR